VGDNIQGLELTEDAEGDCAALLQRSIPGWAGAIRALMAGAHGGCGATRDNRAPCRLAEKGWWGGGSEEHGMRGKTTLVRLAQCRGGALVVRALRVWRRYKGKDIL
jgi:hypothetical protein